MPDSNVTSRLLMLHCSDVHLDTAFAGLTPEKSEERRRILRNTFMSLMQQVRDRKVDVVLISGDLFDRRYVTNATADLLTREFENCRPTQFIIAPGRSDCYRDNPIYAYGRLPENCFVFSSENLERHDLPNCNVTVYGWAFADEEKRENPLVGQRVDDTSRINIVCGYADLDGEIDSTLCPVGLMDVERFGADYYAFGSRHEAVAVGKVGANHFYSYCGSLECTGFEDGGIGGASLIDLNWQDGTLSLQTTPITLGSLRFACEEVDITGVHSPNEILTRISHLISDRRYGVGTALRVELVGSVDPCFIVPKNFESEAFGLYYFHLIDKTMPLFGAEHFRRDMSAAGEAYRTLLPKMQSENEEERLVAARAFRVALAALENREVDL